MRMYHTPRPSIQYGPHKGVSDFEKWVFMALIMQVHLVQTIFFYLNRMPERIPQGRVGDRLGAGWGVAPSRRGVTGGLPGNFWIFTFQKCNFLHLEYSWPTFLGQ